MHNNIRAVRFGRVFRYARYIVGKYKVGVGSPPLVSPVKPTITCA